jgi:hypothetical protein
MRCSKLSNPIQLAHLTKNNNFILEKSPIELRIWTILDPSEGDFHAHKFICILQQALTASSNTFWLKNKTLNMFVARINTVPYYLK